MSTDNTAGVCEQFFSTTTQFIKESPEGRALNDAMLREYKGTIDEGEFQATLTAYNKAFGAALKPIANKATRPELKSALTRLADAYGQGAADMDALKAVTSICEQSTTTAPTT